MRIGIRGIAVKGEEFRAFIRFFTRSVEEDEVHNTGDTVRAVNGRGAILQHFRPGNSPDRQCVDVVEIECAASVDENQGIGRANSAQVDRCRSVATVGIVFRGSVTDE